MKKYSAYKPSGIEWIGDIPEKWEPMKLKHVLLDYQDGTHASFPRVISDYPLLSAKNVFEDGIKISDEESTISEDAYKSIISNGFPQYGDVAICCVGTIGRCCLYTLKESQAFQRSVTFLRPNKKVLNSYLVYLMRSDVANPQYVMYAKTSAQSGIYMEALVNFKIVVPPKDEQIAIAAYLDAKCAKVDNVISVQQKRIELLKELKQSVITNAVTKGLDKNVELKPSGIDWIGDIPSSWELKKIKFISKVNGRVGFKGYTTSDLVGEGEGAFTIGGKHISTNKLNLSDPEFISWEKYYESPEIMVKKGDILTAQRGSLGKVALVKDDIGEATINPSLVLINNIKCVKEYLYWYMVSECMQTDIDLLNTSTAVPMISQNQLENIFVPIPSTTEQISIATYLEKKCSAIDSQISKIERQIELLKEYKQSIITECVTGKRKVC